MQCGRFQERFAVQFHPIIDTADSRVFAYQCSFEEMHGKSPYSPSCSSSFRKHSWTELNELVFVDASEWNAEGFAGQPAMSLLVRMRNLVYQFRLTDPETLSGVQSGVQRIGEQLSAGEAALALEVCDGSSATVRAIERLRPFYVKLDRNLTRNIEQPRNAEAVHRLVSLSERRGFITIADGVEDAVAMENLWLMGVRNMQGNFFSNQKAQRRLVNPVCARKF